MPSVGVIDSQSVKGSNVCQQEVGYDGGKKVKGRKRHVVVDTLGLLLIAVYHSATSHDSKGAKSIISIERKVFKQHQENFADRGGYRGELISWLNKKWESSLKL